MLLKNTKQYLYCKFQLSYKFMYMYIIQAKMNLRSKWFQTNLIQHPYSLMYNTSSLSLDKKRKINALSLNSL